MAPYLPTLRLYRRCIRAVKAQKASHYVNPSLSQQVTPWRTLGSRTMVPSVRELFELYRFETDKEMVARLLEWGEHDVAVFEALAKVEVATGQRMDLGHKSELKKTNWT